MAEKLYIEQPGEKSEVTKEQSFGASLRVELPQDGTSPKVQLPQARTSSELELSKAGTLPNVQALQAEDVSAEVKTSGDKWIEALRQKQEAGIGIELPL